LEHARNLKKNKIELIAGISCQLKIVLLNKIKMVTVRAMTRKQCLQMLGNMLEHSKLVNNVKFKFKLRTENWLSRFSALLELEIRFGIYLNVVVSGLG
jgi:hypothetical protein